MAKTLTNRKGGGTVTELQRGKRYRLRFVGATGQRSVTFYGTATEAKAELADLISQTGKARATSPAAAEEAQRAAQRTVGDLIEAWFASGDFKPETMSSYRARIDHDLIPAFGHILLSDLDAHTIDATYRRWQRDDKISARTIHNRHSALRSALRQGERWGWCTTTATRNATLPKITKPRVVAIPPEDVARLVAAAEGKSVALYLFVRLAVATGARRGEILGLQWKKIDLEAEKPTLTIDANRTRTEAAAGKLGTPKTLAGTRTIDLDDPSIVDLLKKHRVGKNEEDFVVTYSPPGLVTAFAQLCKKAGVQYTIHQIRHSVASQLLNDGYPIPEVARILGHSNSAVTLKIYAHCMVTSRPEIGASLARLAGIENAA
jgi:integrase